jgi:hypothetical protein
VAVGEVAGRSGALATPGPSSGWPPHAPSTSAAARTAARRAGPDFTGPVWGTRRQTDVVEALLRDVLEVAIVVAVGAMVVTVVRRLVAGELRVYHCSSCARPTSRAYPRCRHCHREQPDAL